MAIQQTVSRNLAFALQNKELLEMVNFSCQKTAERHLGTGAFAGLSYLPLTGHRYAPKETTTISDTNYDDNNFIFGLDVSTKKGFVARKDLP